MKRFITDCLLFIETFPATTVAVVVLVIVLALMWAAV